MSTMEKKPVQPVRRCRRAASLTAQALWNIQIEDDSKPVSKTARKSPTLQDVQKIESQKKTLKRVSGEAISHTHKGGKKQKLSTNKCSGWTFQPTKPLQSHAGQKPQTKKLTASVAPLVKPVSSGPRVMRVHNQNVGQHTNPILLLPVSIKTDQGPSGTNEVGSVPVLTFQNPSDFINCIRLNKSVTTTNMDVGRSSWQNSSLQLAPMKTKTVVYPKPPVRSGFGLTGRRSDLIQVSQSGQDEPLNLKMGETKIPSSCKQVFAPGKVKAGSARPVMTCTVSIPLAKTESKVSIAKVSGSVRVEKSKDAIKQISSRTKSGKNLCSRGNTASTLIGKTGSTYRAKQDANCPSPEYACSSPDVDDVHRDARHTCNRPHINLRQKAVPPPGTIEYEEYKVEQRRMLADAILRNQKLSSTLKKPALSRQDSDEERPLLNPKLLANYDSTDSNNGWKWIGKPYFGMVYSVECGKYVRRRCFPAMTRRDEDGLAVVMVRDCVFLCAGGDDESPYVAKVTGLWEKPQTGDMTMSLLWYYRPEHTEDSRVHASNLCDDELFLSRHQDEISVACVEDRCHVLSYSEYCRVQARLHRDQAWRKCDQRKMVPPLPIKRSRARPSLPGESPVDDNNLFFSRRMYDVKGRRVLKYLPPPTSLTGEYSKRGPAT
uniref:Bromo adjacent homology domain-containing 1 protein-like n=1 Tax=Phallusia mammillata TaxID=59560 RepID=A0A6F9D862_9ASCI|nr:bromo adjacent homology domain-containing 1 protein-like [Phallusia mammillata]